MATTDTRPTADDETLTAAERAAIARAPAEPGIILTPWPPLPRAGAGETAPAVGVRAAREV